MDITAFSKELFDQYWCPTADLARAAKFHTEIKLDTVEECREVFCAYNKLFRTHNNWATNVICTLEQAIAQYAGGSLFQVAHKIGFRPINEFDNSIDEVVVNSWLSKDSAQTLDDWRADIARFRDLLSAHGKRTIEIIDELTQVVADYESARG